MNSRFNAAHARQAADNTEREEREKRSAEKRQRRMALPPIDPNRRYPLDVASDYLGQSRAKTYLDIDQGKLQPIKDGRRVYLSGSALIAASRC
jgi:hypothetical protein